LQAILLGKLVICLDFNDRTIFSYCHFENHNKTTQTDNASPYIKPFPAKQEVKVAVGVNVLDPKVMELSEVGLPLGADRSVVGVSVCRRV